MQCLLEVLAVMEFKVAEVPATLECKIIAAQEARGFRIMEAQRVMVLIVVV